MSSSRAEYQSQAPEEKGLIRSSISSQNGKGSLRLIAASNVNASTRYLFVYDGTSTSGRLIMPPIVIPAGGDPTIIDLGPEGRDFADGCYFACSSSLSSYTASAANDLWVNAITDVRWDQR